MAKMFVEFRAQVDFLEVLQSLPLIKRSDDWTKAMERVCKLKYVDDAWIDHTCLITISTETASAKTAEARVNNVIDKVTRILRSYK